MPVLGSQFAPPAFLRNGHIQTILPVLLGRPVRVPSVGERLELPDGDFLDLDWSCAGHDRVAILSHGLEGCAGDGYVRSMAAALNAADWDVLAWTYRGCGSEPNRLMQFYHSGYTADLALVIDRAAVTYSSIALVGFSLGGNLTLKYLGEAAAHPCVLGAATLSAPIDLAGSARRLDHHWPNRLYLRRFLRGLRRRVQSKALKFPRIDTTGIAAIRTFREFDDRYTAPLHGFIDAADYWRRSSARQFLPRIAVPALLLNARDDPFLAPDSFPFREAEESRFLTLEAPDFGGHLGFLESIRPAHSWAEKRVVEFLASLRACRCVAEA